ncbi:hypothetical protein OIU84_018686 [Salix udensis]|uniref:DNA-directed RNA polymerase subunit n=1 Tax=Salix udensis TaxID=889485 RepID=A0AAD6KZE8_9ROSI|nr:hypothetical protein OIU84_018686 [Salix udensis]
MFLKVQLPWNVIIPAENLDAKGLMLQRSIVVCLLDDFAKKRATKDLGYYLAVSTLESIGEGKVRQQTGDVLFPVVFSGITFKIFRGEILEGVVHKVLKHGVLLKCGPIENIYLSSLKMPGYRYVPGENPVFLNDKTSKIGKDVAVRFIVLGTKWLEAEREFQALVSLEGDYLGPILTNTIIDSRTSHLLLMCLCTNSLNFYIVLNSCFIGLVSLQSTSQIFSELTPVTTRVGKLLSGSLPAH